MGAGQIGGIATLLDIDFENAAGFMGEKAENSEAQFVVYYLSHAMLFCLGAIIEAHVILTPASCIFGEKYKFEVYAGAHKFLEHVGTTRLVEHVCVHKGYNHSSRWSACSKHNIGLLLLSQAFLFNNREHNTEYIINRIRYGASAEKSMARIGDQTCKYFGWGSRRNGFLIPLLIHLYVVYVQMLAQEDCPTMWRGVNDEYICVQHPHCRSDKFGALCPDDVGSIIECSGHAVGMMTSRLVDRPCGTGFLDLTKYNKFLTCGVDDSRDVISHADDYVHSFEISITSDTPLSTVEQTVKLASDEDHHEEEKKEHKEEKEAKKEEEEKKEKEDQKEEEEKQEEEDKKDEEDEKEEEDKKEEQGNMGLEDDEKKDEEYDAEGPKFIF